MKSMADVYKITNLIIIHSIFAGVNRIKSSHHFTALIKVILLDTKTPDWYVSEITVALIFTSMLQHFYFLDRACDHMITKFQAQAVGGNYIHLDDTTTPGTAIYF